VLATGQEEGIGIVPSKKRWERKQKARDRSVKFQGKSPTTESKSLEVRCYTKHVYVFLHVFHSLLPVANVHIGKKEKEFLIHPQVPIYEEQR
jgi:hypothetical protein